MAVTASQKYGRNPSFDLVRRYNDVAIISLTEFYSKEMKEADKDAVLKQIESWIDVKELLRDLQVLYPELNITYGKIRRGE
jgi:hypothetical protein